MSEIKIKTTEETTIPLKEVGLESVDVAVEHSFREKTMMAKEERDPTTKAKAYDLYMDHVPYRKIQEVLNIPKGTLLTWVYTGKWADLRNQHDEVMLKDALESKKALLNSIALEVMQGVLKAIQRDTKDGGFKAKDVPTYLAALTSVEKLSRLSLGLATSISEERSKRAQFVLPAEHLKQIQEVKIKDPFSEPIDVEPTTNPRTDTNSTE